MRLSMSRNERIIKKVMADVDRYGYAPYPVPPGHPAWCALTQRLGHPPGMIPNGMRDTSPAMQQRFQQSIDAMVSSECGDCLS